jgi:putative FmdB family regulatory protein
MPIYEHICQGCKKKVSLLILNPKSYGTPQCPNCGSEKLERVMSRFRTPQSEERRMERLADPSSFTGLDENDPSSVAKWAKKMGRELGGTRPRFQYGITSQRLILSPNNTNV